MCILTYAGYGYSAAYVAELERVVRMIGEGTPVRIVSGPDAICTQLLADEGGRAHCLATSVAERDARARADISRSLGISLGDRAEFVLDSQKIGDLRRAFSEGSVRAACAECEWNTFCSRIAQAAYATARL